PGTLHADLDAALAPPAARRAFRRDVPEQVIDLRIVKAAANPEIQFVRVLDGEPTGLIGDELERLLRVDEHSPAILGGFCSRPHPVPRDIEEASALGAVHRRLPPGAVPVTDNRIVFSIEPARLQAPRANRVDHYARRVG